MAKSYEEAASFELRFWLQVLGDHGRFLKGALHPDEQKDIKEAEAFIAIFDSLLASMGHTDLKELSRKALDEAKKIRAFKLELMKKQLTGQVKINFTPSFLNHMVNEAEECIRVLESLQNGEIPPIYHELHHHLVWLLDAAGHAGAISANLDRVEKQIIEKSNKYMKRFEDFYLKAVEMAGFLRTDLSSFPALSRMNSDVSLEMRLFMGFLEELEELELSEQALGSFSALMADHMFREECYYLTKVAEAAEMPEPGCDPGKPRIQKS